MAGVIPRYTSGPVTYDVGARVRGGRLVEPDSNGKVVEASAGSLTVLGVATKDAAPSYTVDGTTPGGYPAQDLSAVYLTPHVAVGKENEWPLLATADVTFGQRIQAGAEGTVVPWDGTTVGACVGHCTDPKGVLSGQTGLFKISL